MNETKNNITELVFILDKSGSMHGLEKDTIGGFNSMIEQQKKEDGEVYVNTVLFSDRSELLHDRVKLSEIQPMTDEDYHVDGCTALLDAVGGAVKHIRNIHKYLRPKDVPAHTMFVITTDGMENASHKYSYSYVKNLVEHMKEKYSWEFLFIGANLNAAEAAENIGISRDRSANYRSDSIGTASVFCAVSAPISAMRRNKKIDRKWIDEIENDLKNRK